MVPEPAPAELVEVARAVAAAAGAFLLDGWSELDPVRDVATKTGPTDVVTRLDVESERLVRSLLAEARPGEPVLGEEQGSDVGDAAVRWVVDPLDGSVNYVYGLPTWAVSVAAVIGGTTVAGAVDAPALGRSYWAAAGGGAYRDGRPLRVSDRSEPALALVATGFAYDADLRARQGVAAGRLLAQVRDIRRLGSAALDLCLLAEGAVDGYYERGLNEWDRAAGMLIATEAGAVVEVHGDLVLGAGPRLVDRLRALLTRCGA